MLDRLFVSFWQPGIATCFGKGIALGIATILLMSLVSEEAFFDGGVIDNFS